MGNNFITLERHTIYFRGTYYLCIPNEQLDNYQLFLGLPNQDLTQESKENIINEMQNINSLINNINRSGIYILPIIPPHLLEEATNTNDNQKFEEIVFQKIMPITQEIYQEIINQNKKVEQEIAAIIKNETDKKLISWMSSKLGTNFIRSIEYERLKELQTNNNTFSSGIAPIDRQYEDIPTQEKKNTLIKVRKKEMNSSPYSHGFGSIKFIILILTISFALGISIGYLLIK